MNPYEVLGIEKTATPATVRRAYRRKAAAAHPDNPNTGNTATFHEITRAHKILADPLAKQVYDETGIVMGEDRLAEEAIMWIVGTSAEVLANNPTCDLPRMLRLTLDQLQKQVTDSVALIQKCIAQVESRWKGGDVVRDTLLMNMHGRVAQLNRKTEVHERAKQLLSDVSYEPAAQAADSLVDLFMSRR